MRSSLALMTMALFASPAFADLPAPRLVPGQHVYFIPDGYFNPDFNGTQIQRINTAAQSLKYPFFVVVSQYLPGGTDQAAADAINSIAEQWTRHGGFDPGTSSVFLVSYAPQKWRFVAGTEWQSKFGMIKKATATYTNNFVTAAKRRPRDLAGGIINTMTAFDSYLWEQTDPVRIAAREKTAQEEAARTRLREAKANIDGAIEHLSSLLTDKEYLPKDVTEYTQLATILDQARKSDNADTITSVTGDALPKIQKLDGMVSLKQSEASARTARHIAETIFFLLIAGAIGIWYFRRKRRFNSLRDSFEIEATKWEQMVTNASNNYASVYLDRDDLVGMSSIQGDTKKLYDSVTAEVNDIYLCIKALEAHVAECRALAESANLFDMDPLLKAKTDLDGDFQFDTEKVNADELFGRETKVIKVNAAKFAADQATRFKKAKSEWDRLKTAARERVEPLDAMLKSKSFEECKAKATGVWQRWIKDHPLYDGLDTITKTLNSLRVQDPIAAHKQATELLARGAVMESRFSEMYDAVESIKKAKPDKLPDFTGTILSDKDNPQEILKQAADAETKLAGMLASFPVTDSSPVIGQAKQIADLYRRATQQSFEIKAAIEQAAQAITRAQSLRSAADQGITIGQKAIDAAEKVHDEKGLKAARDTINTAQKRLSAGSADLETAVQAINTKKHLEALRAANSAAQSYTTAAETASKAKQICNELDRKKAEFERKQAEIKANYERKQARYRQYGGRSTLQQPTVIIQNNNTNNNRADYDFMLTQIVMEEAMWDQQIASAQQAQEAAERAARQAAEEAERAARYAREESDRQSRYSSRNDDDSSSGSSWSSSDSSDGGSFGGGGSDGSDGGSF